MGGGGFEPPKQMQQIYSLSPLAARESTRVLYQVYSSPLFLSMYFVLEFP